MTEEDYLLKYHKEDIVQILNDDNNNKHYSIYINFIELYENNPEFGDSILKEPDTALQNWNNALIKAQHKLIDNKADAIKKIHCRLHCLPVCPELVRTAFPSNDDAGKFLEMSGTVVRITEAKLLEFERQYICVKCKYPVTVKADYERKNTITPPKKCPNPDNCKGTNLVSLGELDTDNCKDYQEIKIQEQVTKLGIGSIPSSMWVTLEDDLVDICKPGDSVTICGTVKRRWAPLTLGKKTDIDIVFKANYLQVNNTYGSASVTPEIKAVFENFWKTYSHEPLLGRDIILKSICPQLFGLYFVKLATALVLAGGSHVEDLSLTGVRIRSEAHLLLVGDPGTGKSHLLRFASKIIPRSVLTTGVGSTAAGLTVTAVKENNEWQLEGGALVMADGGICCIDEFNSMREHDRTSIHEAMEQQTISVAKASIVCKLSTRCTILAACNPKGHLDPNQPLSLNVAMASPLLSRFDLILLLRDSVNEDWDSLVCDYIFNGRNTYSKLTESNLWSLELLQAYFKIIKKINPKLTENSNIILSRYYQCQRRIDHRNKSRTTVRLLDSLIRLAQGHAKLMYHETVQIIDAVFAIILVDTAMENEGRILNLNLNTHSIFSDNPSGDYLEMLEIILGQLHLEELLEQERQCYLKGGKTKHSKGTKSRFFNGKNNKDTDTNGGNTNSETRRDVDETVHNFDDAITSTQLAIHPNETGSKLIDNEIDNQSTPEQLESNTSTVNQEQDSQENTRLNKQIGGSDVHNEFNNVITSTQTNPHAKKTCNIVINNETDNPSTSAPLETNTSTVNIPRTKSNNAENTNTNKRFRFKSTKTKSPESKKFKSNYMNDMELIKHIPSANDDLRNLNFDEILNYSTSDHEEIVAVEHPQRNSANKLEVLVNCEKENRNENVNNNTTDIKKGRLKELFGFKPREDIDKTGNTSKTENKCVNIIQKYNSESSSNSTISRQTSMILSQISNEDIDFEL